MQKVHATRIDLLNRSNENVMNELIEIDPYTNNLYSTWERDQIN